MIGQPPKPETAHHGGRWDPGTPLINAADWAAKCVKTVVSGYPHIMDLHLRLPTGPESARVARTAAREAIENWDLTEPLDDTLLVVSELVTNAFHYGSGRLVLHLSVEDGYLIVGVQDDKPESPPTPRDAPDTQPGGRGLKLISSIASHWGWESRDGHKIVWAQIPTETRP